MHVRQGYYGFQDYAVQHCLDHFEHRTRLESHEDIYQRTMESAREFLATYSLSVPLNLAEMSHQDMANFFSQLPKDKRERASTFSIEYSTLDIRAVIEQVRVEDLTPEEETLISNVYGNQITYKCPKIWCDYFSTGFDNNEDRRKHVDSHERPFRCSDECCFAFQLGYSRKCKLEEHKIKYHSPVEDEVRFPKAMTPRDNDTLLEAAGRNDLDAMLAFLESGILVDGTLDGSKKHSENRIPICRAAKNGNIEACKLLIEWGANLSSHWKDSPMPFAIDNHDPDLAHCLLSEAKEGIPVVNLSFWIERACQRAQPDTVRILVESSHFRSYGMQEWKPKVPGWIQAACGTSVINTVSVTIVKYLLGKGFPNCVDPKVLSNIKKCGGDYLAGLLRPFAEGENPALMDYQRQLMLLEQQNKKRMMMQRQEQDRILHDPQAGPRTE